MPLDINAYPILVELIFELGNWSSLLKMHTACKELRDRADRKSVRHLVIREEYGTHALLFQGRCNALSPVPHRIPVLNEARDFSSVANLGHHVRTIQVGPLSDDSPLPSWFSRLPNVNTVYDRDLGEYIDSPPCLVYRAQETLPQDYLSHEPQLGPEGRTVVCIKNRPCLALGFGEWWAVHCISCREVVVLIHPVTVNYLRPTPAVHESPVLLSFAVCIATGFISVRDRFDLEQFDLSWITLVNFGAIPPTSAPEATYSFFKDLVSKKLTPTMGPRLVTTAVQCLHFLSLDEYREMVGTGQVELELW